MSFWPVNFEENNAISAKSILEEEAKMLPKLTKEMVYAEIRALSVLDAAMESIENDFAFVFEIRGKFLENYKFKVFTFSHDITLYPVKFKIDEKIAKELQVPKKINGYFIDAENRAQTEHLVHQIFNSRHLGNVVGSIMSLSK